MTVKELLIYGIIVVECGVYGCWYIAGEGGRRKIAWVKEDNKKLLVQQSVLQERSQALSLQLKEWREDDFHVEYLARELGMSYPKDILYVQS